MKEHCVPLTILDNYEDAHKIINAVLEKIICVHPDNEHW